MKKNKLFVLLLAVLIVFSSISLYAQTLTVNQLLNKLTRPRLTSLQVMDRIKEYKGDVVRGSGKVTDVVQSFGSEDAATVYLATTFMSKKYELVLLTDIYSGEKIKRGKRVRFEGIFSGMNFRTLRFESVEIMERPWWLL